LSNESAVIALLRRFGAASGLQRYISSPRATGSCADVGGGPGSCQASYGWLVPLAKELQVAKIAAIETFLDLATLFAREAVLLVFLPSFEARTAILRRCVGPARFDCLHNSDLAITYTILAARFQPPTLNDLQTFLIPFRGV
jgi:hypothetical protein